MKINNKKPFKHYGEDVMNVSTEIAEEKTDKDTATRKMKTLKTIYQPEKKPQGTCTHL